MKQSKNCFSLMLGLLLFGCGGTDSDLSNSQGASLPPDPGREGKKTLAGIDSDQDGVRDDVQIAIFNRYPNEAQKRAALGQNANAIQEAIIAGGTFNVDGIN